MNPDQDFFTRFTHVMFEGRSYLNLIYLLLMLPLGIIYFTLVVTGISLSLSLLIILIGIFIGFIFILLMRGISGIHLAYASALLGFELPPKQEKSPTQTTFFEKMKEVFTDAKTYTGLVYMFIELPLGIIYFTFVVTFLSISVSFTLSPIFWIVQEETDLYLGDNWLWYMEFDETILLSLVGIVIFFATLHIGKLLAKVEAFLCKNLLVRL